MLNLHIVTFLPVCISLLMFPSCFFQKYILSSKTQELSVSTIPMMLYAKYQNQNPAIISSDSTTFFLPSSLIRPLFGPGRGEAETKWRRPCVLSVLTELPQSPYTWAHTPAQVRAAQHADVLAN